MWLSNGTRGDIAFAIGAVSRILHKRPKYEVFLAENILKYVNKTKLYVLEYLPGGAAKERSSKHLPEPRDWRKLEIYSQMRCLRRAQRCPSISSAALRQPVGMGKYKTSVCDAVDCRIRAPCLQRGLSGG